MLNLDNLVQKVPEIGRFSHFPMKMSFAQKDNQWKKMEIANMWCTL